MKKWLAAALCTAAAMSASSALAANINFVTAGTSSTFYPISATVCQLWNDSIEGMRATATPSGGGIDNLNQALDGEAQIGIANANLVYQAQQGTDSFEGYANENLRIFAGLYYNPNQVVVIRDSGIETLEDLVGKHISVGAAGSTTVDECISRCWARRSTTSRPNTWARANLPTRSATSSSTAFGSWRARRTRPSPRL